MRRSALLLGLTVLATAVPAAAATSPVVPSFVQSLIRTRAGALAYVPARLPRRYRYVRFAASPSRVLIVFADRRFPSDGRHSLVFSVLPSRGSLASCADGKIKTLQLDGNRVYWDGTTAWRCQPSLGGAVRLATTGPKLPDVALGIVTASGHRSR